jgi:hypothetical protein
LPCFRINPNSVLLFDFQRQIFNHFLGHLNILYFDVILFDKIIEAFFACIQSFLIFEFEKYCLLPWMFLIQTRLFFKLWLKHPCLWIIFQQKFCNCFQAIICHKLKHF